MNELRIIIQFLNLFPHLCLGFSFHLRGFVLGLGFVACVRACFSLGCGLKGGRDFFYYLGWKRRENLGDGEDEDKEREW